MARPIELTIGENNEKNTDSIRNNPHQHCRFLTFGQCR